jgi:hypothetical protein
MSSPMAVSISFTIRFTTFGLGSRPFPPLA